MPATPWHQANVAFADWNSAEPTALAHLAPPLREAEDRGDLTSWFHIRKRPCWRIRYQPATDGHDPVPAALDALTAQGHITGWTVSVYEPEIHAFGGPDAMDTAHRLFHQDSRHLTTHLHEGAGQRRETSLLLCSLLMRSAGLDWYEQGDAWARVAAHRPLTETAHPTSSDRHHDAVHRLISVDTESLVHPTGPLAHLADWARAYTDAATELARLTASGHLHRGLRHVVAHHVLFAWNRAGLPQDDQATLASAAKTVIFGPDPTTSRSHRADTA
ncbi:thiopeptide-type bacteriocin biosynthesis protein [Streptomyces sp. NPDC096097]|uniref:thiopeptide-type bacteriocin biosynthesis protein n=1 Tax=Streptomyces sp. NPDC096097 TaxID=3155546 RepID=UPI0033340938